MSLVPAEIVSGGVTCGDCGRLTDQPKRVAGTGRRLCTVCYQRARRSREPDAAFGVTVYLHLHRELTALGLSWRTVNQYANTIQNAERWFVEQGWHLATAHPWQVVAYLDTRPATWATRNIARCALKTYWELVGHPKPPLRSVRVPPKPEMVCRALTDEDARVLAGAARARGDAQGLAVILGLYQALRREEIATTRWDAIEDSGWLTVMGKGSKRRRIPLHAVTVEALTDVLATRDDAGPWVFPGRPFSGRPAGPVSVATIWQWIRDVAQEAGLPPIKCHWLRHTALATQNDVTGDLRAVQAFAGHSRPEITSGYTRAKDTALRNVVDSLDY